VPVVNLTGSDQLIATAAPLLHYRGFSVRETSGSASALLRIFDGTTATGNILEEVALTASQTARELYPLDGALTCSVGIYVDIVSGAVSGSVRYE
jgi:hypothetical protein